MISIYHDATHDDEHQAKPSRQGRLIPMICYCIHFCVFKLYHDSIRTNTSVATAMPMMKCVVKESTGMKPL